MYIVESFRIALETLFGILSGINADRSGISPEVHSGILPYVFHRNPPRAQKEILPEVFLWNSL